MLLSIIIAQPKTYLIEPVAAGSGIDIITF